MGRTKSKRLPSGMGQLQREGGVRQQEILPGPGGVLLPKAHVQLQVQIQLAYEHIHHLELRVYLHQDALAAVGVLPGFRPAG